jgi:hypothetical protein
MTPTAPDSVADLIARRRIDTVTPNPRASAEWINDARRHLASAELLVETDPRLAYAAAHDAARKAITAHMNLNGLRPASGDGSHRAVVGYARERMASMVSADTREALDELREGRRVAESGEEPSVRIGPAEVRAAIEVASAVVDAVAGAMTAQGRPRRPRGRIGRGPQG